MYSAMAKLFLAFGESLLWCLVAVLIVGIAGASSVAICEYAHAFHFLPVFIERVYLSLGGI